MKLKAFVIDGLELDIRPAAPDRAWMDATTQRYAYRCLPMNIANSHGWELLCPSGFNAVWNGGSGVDAISVVSDPGSNAPPPVTHFGFGILTFHMPCLFRTDPGFDLMVQGPVNRPKDAIGPLAGVVESDWGPFSFTMNWQFTRPGTPIRFDKGEPYCHIFPVRRGELESIEPEISLLRDNPELSRQYEHWRTNRDTFNAHVREPGTQQHAEQWQKNYHRGVDPMNKQTAAEDHRTRLRLKPFAKPASS